MYTSLLIKPTSPNLILEWSSGETLNAETINYRTYKPVKGGLYCTKIFGPLKNYHCDCGIYLSINNTNYQCSKCGVNRSSNNLRRDRLSHIKLVCTLSHYWYLKTLPHIYSILLNMNYNTIYNIIYCYNYIVTKSTIITIPIGTVIPDDKYFEHILEYGSSLLIETGANAIKTFLRSLDLNLEINKILTQLKYNKRPTNQHFFSILKKLRLLTLFLDNNIKPQWLTITILPILPPTLRPILITSDNKITCSDINILYQLIITRNLRLKKLILINAPHYIIKEAKRLLQYSVDTLYGAPSAINIKLNNNNYIKPKTYKSLVNSFAGKHGRFRYNLLGKRIDYSARAVIVVEPNTRITKCGIPFSIMSELYKPIILRYLITKHHSKNVTQALYTYTHNKSLIISIINILSRNCPILLNRAPTLHRMNIQSFYTYLVNDNALHIHPLVCKNFNADFDGDQMSIYLPLTNEAKLEAIKLLSINNNIFSPANGDPTFLPSHESMLGIYYLTNINILTDKCRLLTYREVINYFINDINSINKEIYYKVYNNYIIRTTIGRVIFLSYLPYTDLFIRFNRLINKSIIQQIIKLIFIRSGNTNTCLKYLINITKLGFKYITLYGYTLNINNFNLNNSLPILPNRLISLFIKVISSFRRYKLLLTDKLSISRRIWINILNNTNINLINKLSITIINLNNKVYLSSNLNNLVSIIKSGAKKLTEQVNQLCGLRGFILSNDKQLSIIPILDNLINGLSINQYFISLSGSRKGLCDTSIKTALSGYLTRKLIYSSYDAIIYNTNCGTLNGLRINLDTNLQTNYLIGRVLLTNTYDKLGNILYPRNTLITNTILLTIINKLSYIYIRSPIYCLSSNGICSYCYGIDISRKLLVNIGNAVGIISSQSICEPCTQLTMRTFHTGGFICSLYTNTYRYNLYTLPITSSTLRLIPISTYYNKYTLKYVNNQCPYCKGILLTLNHLITIINNHNLLTINNDYNQYTLNQILYLISLTPSNLNKNYCLNLYILNKGILYMLNYNNNIINSLTLNKGNILILCLNKLNTLYLRINLINNKYIKQSRLLIYNDYKLITKPSIINKPLMIGRITMPYILIRSHNNILKYRLTNTDFIKLKHYKLPVGTILSTYIKLKHLNFDITDRLSELSSIFDNHEPKNKSILSIISGQSILTNKGISIYKHNYSNPSNRSINYITTNKQLINLSSTGIVLKGTKITIGNIYLNDIIKIMGLPYLTNYFINRLSNIYLMYGIKTNKKHYEITLRSILFPVSNYTNNNNYLPSISFIKTTTKTNSNINKLTSLSIKSTNNIVVGVTRSITLSNSFITSASFRDTIKVLITSSLLCLKDPLIGINENIIFGFLVPIGTGLFVKQYGYNNK